jgi:shikimate kinase/3-dehydroquinate synthase
VDAPLEARHLALIGFMGAGKSTLGAAVAERLGRRLVDVDEVIEASAGMTVAEIFRLRGEPEFRLREEEEAARALATREPLVIALGGGAVLSERTRRLLRDCARTVRVATDVDTAWRRVRGGDRPLAQDEAQFRALYREREPLYEEAADAGARSVDDVVLAAAGIHADDGALGRLGDLVPGEGQTALVSDAGVAGIHGVPAELALGRRLASTHTLPAGEEAKQATVVERLWGELRLDRGGTLVALGGGCTTDTAGFAAATYLRGVAWVAVPTTLVGQVDAAIGGKTAIDLPGGKNLVGAFHWPAATVIDPVLLQTLPEAERRNGLAEVVKTGLLAGEALWELPDAEQVRRCAAFKAAVCLRDPREQGERAILNLGHTFAHALEAAAGYELPHGQAVALGLTAALRLSGLEEEARQVEELLRPQRVAASLDQAWAALARDKKGAAGRPRLVLLDGPGLPRYGVELPDEDVRAALASLLQE